MHISLLYQNRNFNNHAHIPLRVKRIAIVITLLLVMLALNGCVYPQIEKVKRFFVPPPKYEWVKKVDEKGDFGVFDILNKDLGKKEYFPFSIENGTKFLHIYIHVNFSKPIGYLNLTIVTPEKNITKDYMTLAKSYKYDDFLYFDDPEPGNWKIVIKVTGIGEYRLLAEAYQKS